MGVLEDLRNAFEEAEVALRKEFESKLSALHSERDRSLSGLLGVLGEGVESSSVSRPRSVKKKPVRKSSNGSGGSGGDDVSSSSDSSVPVRRKVKRSRRGVSGGVGGGIGSVIQETLRSSSDGMSASELLEAIDSTHPGKFVGGSVRSVLSQLKSGGKVVGEKSGGRGMVYRVS